MTKRSYKIAVLMSVYRCENPSLFKRAVRSVLSQVLSTPTTVRVYLGVDGPVPDALAETINELSPKMYRVYWYPENRGLGCVLNDLIHSREDEDFLFRMDTDDISHPHRFDRQIKFMETHPDIDILGTDIIEVQKDSGSKRIVHFADNPAHARQSIAWRVPVAHPTVCFRASVFDKVPGYPPVPMNEDISMWFECMKAGLLFHNIPEPLYEFTIDDNFWNRRGIVKSWLEYKSYAVGLRNLEGPSWRLVFPLARFLFRLLPHSVQRPFYKSSIRRSQKLAQDIGGQPA